MTTFPFEVPFEQVQANLEVYVTAVFSCLESEFLVLPKGIGFVEYPIFEDGCEGLKQATAAFTNVTLGTVYSVVTDTPISLIVLRTMLGFTPPEWAYIVTQRTGVEVSQGFIRSLARRIRIEPFKPLGKGKGTIERIRALIDTACQLLLEGVPQVEATKIHRLDKADTRAGLDSVRTLVELGVPYAMLLYERFLGRLFAGHRDSVSELGGRGFGIRREDMKKLLYATRGKVLTLKTLDRLVECSRLKEFQSQ